MNYSTRKTGSGNQCCYDAGGNLKYSSDSFQGSTPDRSHAWGGYPYGRVDLVPHMSHWLKDVVTFYQCCLWTDYIDCDYYMDQRSTRDCKSYNPPTPGTKKNVKRELVLNYSMIATSSP